MIEGEKTILRPLNRIDIEIICQWEAGQHITTAIFDNTDKNLSIVEKYMSRVNSRTTRMFAVETKKGELIGDIGLVEINWRKNEAELIVRIGHQDYLGRGYGYDAVSCLLNFIFSTTKLNNIYLRVFADNIRAVKCFERCGFRKSWVTTRQIHKQNNPKRLFLMTIEGDKAS